MLGFWVSLRKVGLGPEGHGEPQKEFEQVSGMNRYFTGWSGRPPEKQEIIHTHSCETTGRWRGLPYDPSSHKGISLELMPNRFPSPIQDLVKRLSALK